jgi:hypothetical protein
LRAAKIWVPQVILAVSIPNTPEGARRQATARNAVQFLLTGLQFAKEEFKVQKVKRHDDHQCLSSDSVSDGFRPSLRSKTATFCWPVPGSHWSFRNPKTPGSSRMKLLAAHLRQSMAKLSDQHKTGSRVPRKSHQHTAAQSADILAQSPPIWSRSIANWRSG